MAFSQASTQVSELLFSPCSPHACASRSTTSLKASIAPRAVARRGKCKNLAAVANLPRQASVNTCRSLRRQGSSFQRLFSCSPLDSNHLEVKGKVNRGRKGGATSSRGAIASSEKGSEGSKEQRMGRRKVLELAALVTVVGNLAIGTSPAQAFKPPPEGFRRYTDRLDGFTLLYPEFWVQVRGSGAEVQFRSPLNGDENLFVAVSSPSSSNYVGVKDLGSPEQSGNVIKKQYVAEFMSTRLGVRRKAELLNASSKEVEEGKPYYQIEMSVKSEANSNQLAVTPEERVPFVEWDRRYITVQAVENKRLYELRLQIPADIYGRERPALQTVIDSFRTFPVEGFEGSK